MLSSGNKIVQPPLAVGLGYVRTSDNLFLDLPQAVETSDADSAPEVSTTAHIDSWKRFPRGL